MRCLRMRCVRLQVRHLDGFNGAKCHPDKCVKRFYCLKLHGPSRWSERHLSPRGALLRVVTGLVPKYLRLGNHRLSHGEEPPGCTCHQHWRRPGGRIILPQTTSFFSELPRGHFPVLTFTIVPCPLIGKNGVNFYRRGRILDWISGRGGGGGGDEGWFYEDSMESLLSNSFIFDKTFTHLECLTQCFPQNYEALPLL